MVFKLFWDQSWVENLPKQTKFEVFQAKEMQQNKKSRPQRWSFQSESRLEELSSGSRAEHEAALIWKHSTRLSGWKNKNRSYVLLCLLSWVTLSPCLSLCLSSSSFCFDTKRRRKTNSEVFWLSAAASTNPDSTCSRSYDKTQRKQNHWRNNLQSQLFCSFWVCVTQLCAVKHDAGVISLSGAQ